MNISNFKLWTAASVTALAILATPVAAQDPDALTNHANTVLHDSMLRHNLEYARKHQKGRGGASSPNARQANACANRARFSREYGADHPKVRQLYALCAQHGY